MKTILLFLIITTIPMGGGRYRNCGHSPFSPQYSY